MADWPISAPFQPQVMTPHSQQSLGQYGTLGFPLNGVWPFSNRALFYPFRLMQPFLVNQFFVVLGTAATQTFDVGVYDVTGTRLVSTGQTTVTVINTVTSVKVTDTLLGPGMFFLALCCNNVTIAFLRSAGPSAALLRSMGCLQQDSIAILPANATFTGITSAYVPVFGVTERAFT